MSKYKTPNRVKIGKSKYVCGYDGHPLIGLSWNPANGYYYLTESKQRLSKDYDTALMKFRQIQENKPTVNVKTDKNLKVDKVSTKKLTGEDKDFFRQLYSDLDIKKDIPYELRFGVENISVKDYSHGENITIHSSLDLPEEVIVIKAKELFVLVQRKLDKSFSRF